MRKNEPRLGLESGVAGLEDKYPVDDTAERGDWQSGGVVQVAWHWR
jgi:hypothetical protein